MLVTYIRYMSMENFIRSVKFFMRSQLHQVKTIRLDYLQTPKG